MFWIYDVVMKKVMVYFTSVWLTFNNICLFWFENNKFLVDIISVYLVYFVLKLHKVGIFYFICCLFWSLRKIFSTHFLMVYISKSFLNLQCLFSINESYIWWFSVFCFVFLPPVVRYSVFGLIVIEYSVRNK